MTGETNKSDWRDRYIEDLKDSANAIYQNAESIVGTEEYLSDVTVTIYINHGEATRVNVDRNFFPDNMIKRRC